MNGILKAPQAAPVQSVNGKTGAVALAAPDVGAMSTWGGAINSGYNSANGDAYIRRATAGNTGALLMSANTTCLYRIVNDAQLYRIFDEGLPPWGGETVTQISAEMMTNCTSHELSNCIIMQRCGIVIVSLSGIELAAGTASVIKLPYTSRFRCQTWMYDLTAPGHGTLAYIDGANSLLNLYPSSVAIYGGYCTLTFPANV